MVPEVYSNLYLDVEPQDAKDFVLYIGRDKQLEYFYKASLLDEADAIVVTLKGLPAEVHSVDDFFSTISKISTRQSISGQFYAALMGNH